FSVAVPSFEHHAFAVITIVCFRATLRRPTVCFDERGASPKSGGQRRPRNGGRASSVASVPGPRFRTASAGREHSGFVDAAIPQRANERGSRSAPAVQAGLPGLGLRGGRRLAGGGGASAVITGRPRCLGGGPTAEKVRKVGCGLYFAGVVGYLGTTPSFHHD